MIRHMAYISPARWRHPGHHDAPTDSIGPCPCIGCGKIVLRGEYARGFLDAARVGRGYRWLATMMGAKL